MGAVWRAVDERLGRTVAVKQLLLQPGAPGFDTAGQEYGEARQRILREGRLAARLQHAHAIAVFDVVLHDDAPWLVMEYLPSDTLGARLATEGPGEPREVAGIGRQIADGLAAAHAAGIVHRDIKPGNVLIGTGPYAGTVKITDFGVSRAADDVQLTRTGLIAGTPAYLAPEVARGEEPTTASDVYALGSTLYAAVEGEPPFGVDDNAYALLYKVGAGSIRAPERAGPLTEALLHMLHTDPAERPTAEVARAELAAVATGRVSPMPPRPRAAGATEGLRSPTRPTPPGPRSRPGAGRSAGAPAPTRVDLEPPSPPPPVATGGRSGPSAPAPRRPMTDERDRSPVTTGGPARSRGGSVRSQAGAVPGRAVASRPARSPAKPGFSRLADGRRTRVLGLCALLVLVAVATVLVVMQLPGRSPTGSAGRPAGSAGLAGAKSPGPASPGPAAPGPSAGIGDGTPTAADLEGFVRGYYALLPGQPERAWTMLGSSARAASNGFGGYTTFYGGLASVSFAEPPSALDGRTVGATLRFDPKSGGESVERYRFTVVPGPDGRLVMSSFTRG
jgi:serine/threonine protein kinase